MYCGVVFLVSFAIPQGEVVCGEAANLSAHSAQTGIQHVIALCTQSGGCNEREQWQKQLFSKGTTSHFL